MKLFRLEFSLLALLLMILLASLFTGLGRWQLERMHEKQAIEAELLERSQLPAAALPRDLERPETWRFRAVSIEGTPLSQRQFLLDNEVRNGRVGYAVLTPFALDDGRVVLVDRGWVPVGGSRSELPQVEIPERRRRVEGRVYVPFGEPYSLGEAGAGDAPWPRVIQYLDFNAIAVWLRAQVPPLVVRMDAEEDGGYLRNWSALPFSADRHLAYAVQWFALALAVVVVFVLLSFSKKAARWW